MQERGSFDTLVAIMDRLRGPGGCPWDREQSYLTLRPFLIEECYEVAEALDAGDAENLREELGDLLLQIVFLSRLAKEDGSFDAADVVQGIVDKMIRRHPHVFGDASAETADAVLEHWEAIKRAEKEAGREGEERGSILDGLPRQLPALLKAHRLGDRAARVGFDWNESRQVLEKIEEELGELRAALASGDARQIDDEVGDLLFSVAMFARKAGVDPEGALERSNGKFAARFRWIERELARRGVALADADTATLERLWIEAKTRTGS